MSKVKFPSYIKDSNGRMEDAVFVNWRGSTYMRPYKKREGVCTPKQAEVRKSLSSVAADWKYFSGIIAEIWERSVEGKTMIPINAFVGANMKHRRMGEPLDICLSAGEAPLMNFTAAAGAGSGEITCTFLPPETGRHITFFTRIVTDLDERPAITRHDAGGDAVSPFTITGLEPGTVYHVHAVVTDSDYDSAVTVSASVSAESPAG